MYKRTNAVYKHALLKVLNWLYSHCASCKCPRLCFRYFSLLVMVINTYGHDHFSPSLLHYAECQNSQFCIPILHINSISFVVCSLQPTFIRNFTTCVLMLGVYSQSSSSATFSEGGSSVGRPAIWTSSLMTSSVVILLSMAKKASSRA